MWIREHRSLIGQGVDPVAIWTHVVLERTRITEQERRHSGPPSLRVQTSLGFLLLVAFNQLLSLRLGVEGALGTMLALPLAIFVQELPRALLGCALGRSSKIMVSAVGDTQLGGPPLRGLAQWGFLTVGSIANVLLAVAISRLCPLVHARGAMALYMLAGCQAAWGLGQALPLFPFRAGRAIAHRLRPRARQSHALLSVLCVGAVASQTSSAIGPFSFAPILLLAAVASWQHLGNARAERRDERSGAAGTARLAAHLVLHDDPRAAIEVAQQGLLRAQSLKVKSELNGTLAWAAIAQKEPIILHQALEHLPIADIDLHLVAAYLSCCNRLDEAAQLLERAHALGHRATETMKIWLEVLYRSGKEAQALALAQAEHQLLSAEDWQALNAALGE